jgi:hypothetical protein
MKVRKVGSRGTKAYVKDEGPQNWAGDAPLVAIIVHYSEFIRITQISFMIIHYVTFFRLFLKKIIMIASSKG